jgi:hypothetical protein
MTRSVALLLVLNLACARGSPPTPDAAPSIALPELPFPTALPPRSTTTATPAETATATATSTQAAALLPQTRDPPHASGPALEAGVSGLWAAIVQDDPSLAMPFFFPLGAYAQVKDVVDPAADWNYRLVAAYRRDIHALHARLADTASRARLLDLTVPEARARWVEPGEEYNRIGYYRVFGSKLRFDIQGKEGSIDVKSLISWRGEWFVVHLSAFK